jgi:DNA polymerase-3 subunit beta
MMQFTIRRNLLLKPLQQVVGVIENRQTIPILSHVLLEVSGKNLTLQGTDNEISIISHTKVDESVTEWKGTLPAQTLLDLVRCLPEEALISFQKKANHIVMQSGSSRFQLVTLPPQEFPNTAQESHAVSVCLPEKDLYKAIKTTQFAMANQDVRHYLNGMLWDLQPNRLECVATNGHRLASRILSLDSSAIKESIIVPRKAVLELSRLLNESSEQEIAIYFTANQLRVVGSSYQMVSRLIAGNFPDYTKLLPEPTHHRTVLIDRDHFRLALSKQRPLLKNEMHPVVQLELTQNQLKLRASNSRQESGEETLSIQYNWESKEPFRIAFNIDYLDKALDVLEPGNVQIILPPQEGVTLIKQCGGEDHLYLIMPMRI